MQNDMNSKMNKITDCDSDRNQEAMFYIVYRIDLFRNTGDGF